MKDIKFYNLPLKNRPFEKKFINSFRKINSKGRYIIAEYVEIFENNFAKFCGSKYCVAVANGFDAIKLSFMAYKIYGNLKNGDEVLVPANTYIASILAICAANLKPVFVEPNEKTFNISIEDILKKINKKTKAILAVDLYGLPADLVKIKKIAKKYNVILIEDAAQAHGAKINGKTIGSISDATCFSFFPGKNIGAFGDSGAVTTNNLKISKIVKSLRNYGEENYNNLKDRKYKNFYKGINSRMDEIQAIILNEKLKFYHLDQKKRKYIANFYLKNIKNPKILLPSFSKNIEHAWHLFVVRTKNRNKLKKFLHKKKIQTIIHYPIPPHRQVAFKEYRKLKLKKTEQLAKEILSLPNYPTITNKELKYIVNTINKF
jgi:dTDP-4-amino-4,6-dideoxygalactose transaminase